MDEPQQTRATRPPYPASSSSSLWKRSGLLNGLTTSKDDDLSSRPPDSRIAEAAENMQMRLEDTLFVTRPVIYGRSDFDTAKYREQFPRGIEASSKIPRPINTIGSPRTTTQSRQEVIESPKASSVDRQAQGKDAETAGLTRLKSVLRMTSMRQGKVEHGGGFKPKPGVSLSNALNTYGDTGRPPVSYESSKTRDKTPLNKPKRRTKEMVSSNTTGLFDPPKAFYELYVIKRQLLEGHSFVTYVCARKEAPDVYQAAKVWRLSSVPIHSTWLQARSWDVFSHLRDNGHPNILAVQRTFSDQNLRCLVTELTSEGDLSGYISNKQKLEEDESRKCFIQVLGGLEFLHSHGIIHKDVRPETILLVDRELTAKLEVTGTATFLNAPGPYLATELLDIMSSPIVTVLLADGDSLEAKASHTSPRNFMSNGILRIKAHPWIYGRLR